MPQDSDGPSGLSIRAAAPPGRLAQAVEPIFPAYARAPWLCDSTSTR